MTLKCAILAVEKPDRYIVLYPSINKTNAWCSVSVRVALGFDVRHRTSEIQHFNSSTGPLYENCGGRGSRMVGGQSLLSMRCVANQRNGVC